MAKFNPTKWHPVGKDFEKITGNGCNCPKCGKRAIELMTKHHNDYGGTLSTHNLRCECGQYFYVTSYTSAD